MDITISLSDIEVAALVAEQLDANESLDSVIRRQLVPLVTRLISQQFTALKVQYDSLPLEQQVAVLSDLQTLATARGISIQVKNAS